MLPPAAMTFQVSDECRRLGLRAGAIVFRGVSVAPASPALRAAVREQAESVRLRFADRAAVRSAAEVVAFHQLLRKVGVNPRREQASVERLLLFALKYGDLPAINSLVDAYNLVSIHRLCSLGAHDLDRIDLPVVLRLVTGQESFTPLGAQIPVGVSAGEYGYVDAQARLLCRLDILQAEFSKVTGQTSNVLLIVEGTVAHSAEDLAEACTDVVDLITRHCGGSAEVLVVPS